MKKSSVLCVVMFAAVLLTADVCPAASAALGRVYDISGTVTLKRGGAVKALTRDKSLLLPLQEGDEISVKQGRLVMILYKDKKGYEIGNNSTVKINSNELQKITGGFKVIEGLRGSRDTDDTDSMRLGALVLRGMRNCIKVIDPTNTVVLSIVPELRWEIICDDVSLVKVEIMEDKGPAAASVIKMKTETDKTAITVGENILEYGKKYRWTIDGGTGREKAAGRFSIPAKDKAESLMKSMTELSRYENDLAKRLSYIFFLRENDLNDRASLEIEKLRKEFGDNEYVKELFD